jgi:putative hemolysin
MGDPGGPSDPLLQTLIILALILSGGFFSLFEASLLSSHKLRLRSLADEKRGENDGKKYKNALEAAENSRFWIAAVRIWITLLRILIGVIAGYNIAYYRDFWLAAWQRRSSIGEPLAVTAIIAAVIVAAVILGDLLPRLIALTAPEKITAVLFPAVRICTLICRPLVHAAAKITSLIQKVFHVETSRPGMTEDEFRSALEEGEKSGVVESREKSMVEGVFYLGDRPVGTFMTHRSELQWLDIHSGEEEIRAMARVSGAQGCFPVADGTLDNISGAVFLEDMLFALLEGFSGGLKPILRKAQFVPETMSALKAFEAFRRAEADYLFVMDEYGGFAGILSVRDLVEEIVGQLSENEKEDDEIILQDDGTWLADGSVNIDDVSRTLSLNSLAGEHQDYHTLAGFILSLAGEIPRAGACFDHSGFRFRIVDMDGNRIDKVMIYPLEP